MNAIANYKTLLLFQSSLRQTNFATNKKEENKERYYRMEYKLNCWIICTNICNDFIAQYLFIIKLNAIKRKTKKKTWIKCLTDRQTH